MINRKIKAVLVGCGGIQEAWSDAIQNFDDIEIVGLVDLDLEKAENVKKERGLRKALTGICLDEVLQKRKPDAVFDCTVPAAHYDISITALKHGCHVLGEKPMAENMDQAKKMITKATEKQKIYSVIQNRRYMDNIIDVQNFIKSGKIGDINTLNADFYLGPHFGGFREKMKHVLLLDMAIHSFDQARFICAKDPVSVYCHEWNPPNSWYNHGASAVCIFEMTDGVVFNYRGSWCAEGLNTSWECEWQAQCSEGTMRWDGEESITAEKPYKPEKFIRDCRKINVPRKSRIPHSSHAGLIREFADCIKNGGIPQTVCTDNIKSLAMVHAAVESAEKNKKIGIKI